MIEIAIKTNRIKNVRLEKIYSPWLKEKIQNNFFYELRKRDGEEEEKRQAELEAASDKTKWAEFLKEVGNISFFDMKSSQYKTKMNAARAKITEILGL
jgi:hypothetical protein